MLLCNASLYTPDASPSGASTIFFLHPNCSSWDTEPGTSRIAQHSPYHAVSPPRGFSHILPHHRARQAWQLALPQLYLHTSSGSAPCIAPCAPGAGGQSWHCHLCLPWLQSQPTLASPQQRPLVAEEQEAGRAVCKALSCTLPSDPAGVRSALQEPLTSARRFRPEEVCRQHSRGDANQAPAAAAALVPLPSVRADQERRIWTQNSCLLPAREGIAAAWSRRCRGRSWGERYVAASSHWNHALVPLISNQSSTTWLMSALIQDCNATLVPSWQSREKPVLVAVMPSAQLAPHTSCAHALLVGVTVSSAGQNQPHDPGKWMAHRGGSRALGSGQAGG